MSRLRISRLWIVAVLLVLSACQVDVDINLDVAEDGSGTVQLQARFDADAEQAIGGLSRQLRMSDLERAGWDVAVAEADDGSSTAVASKPVSGPSQWQQVLDEIAGPGVFNDVQVTTGNEFATTSQRLSFDLDLSEGWDLFANQALTETLDGEPFGAPIEDVAGDRTIDEIVSVSLQATVVSDADGTPATASFNPRFAAEEGLQLRLESSTENSTAVLLRWIAVALFSLFVLAALLAIVGIVLQRRSDRLRPAPTPAPLASRVPGSVSSLGAAPVSAVATKQAESVRLVIVEPLSVLYGQTHPIDEVLLPFIREQGGSARADTILEGYRSLLAGAMETDAFWELCGLASTEQALDEMYLANRELRSGAADFFTEMQRRRIPIAATTNDSSQWSLQMRERDRLSALWPWLISSDVGASTNNVGMFEVLRRESGVAHGHCLYVDTDIESLDAARELGMKTALFDTGDLDLPEIVGHPVVTDFKSLFGKN